MQFLDSLKRLLSVHLALLGVDAGDFGGLSPQTGQPELVAGDEREAVLELPLHAHLQQHFLHFGQKPLVIVLLLNGHAPVVQQFALLGLEEDRLILQAQLLHHPFLQPQNGLMKLSCRNSGRPSGMKVKS